MWWWRGYWWWVWSGMWGLLWIAFIIGFIFFIKWLAQQSKPKQTKREDASLERCCR